MDECGSAGAEKGRGAPCCREPRNTAPYARFGALPASPALPIEAPDRSFYRRKSSQALDSTQASELPHLRHLARTYRLAKPSLGCATGVLVLQVECRSDRARRSPRAEWSAGAME